MKYIVKLLTIISASALLLTACGSNRDYHQTTGAEESVDGTEADAERQDPQGGHTSSWTSEDPGFNQPGTGEGDVGLSSGAERLCGSYFKAGDFRYRMVITPGGPDDRENLSVSLRKRSMEPQDVGRSNSVKVLKEFHLPYSAGDSSYDLIAGSEGDAGSRLMTVNRDGTVSLEGGGEEAGIYYTYRGNLERPEGFERPLNRTDLIGLTSAQMRFIRNQYYAVYGRIFRSEDLNASFRRRPWYTGTVDIDEFDERLLGGLVKRNIAFLQEAEEEFDERKAEQLLREYEALLPAPYLSLLPPDGEVMVNVSSAAEYVRDKGIYYIAQGTISVPITLTSEQYRALERGEEVTLVTDELTGEETILRKAASREYGEYVLGDEKDGDYVMSAYHPESGSYSLWANSADTRFKKVYQGDIYILKGACEEFYAHFDMPWEGEEAPGNFRVMDFNETAADAPAPYMGNILVRDEKGYVKALYFWGD